MPLPTPSLSVTIDDVGNVSIAGKLDHGGANRTLTCTRCGQQGHARSNRRCPARSE